ncbi:MAG: DUF4293 domain-containing protein [Flavobacteriales bacterium CG_4_8_14_3_um_filter_35_10]|nr:DUF4293 domain-containing protein [Zetaproteobacteria bacterium]OIO08814.1 MAG: hypothetical protein AUJ53_10905 [Flavobacteriaceae bacterium CG1_02_35_72]PIR13455.1 MAG: hypothetical protein COV50_05945 [Flavobacteriales bacterium CG11_big_fil_rev_8_21_14_0_20_35_7]PIX06901.1 MAG: DUF4293 domain-containing protein [Flavobacteriales bacterium CG_4_8_14_3_um_filter_35_10]PJA06079.1 MAG: DUF4293 domain-containing protein [Flavobacteriales bacterium CG_4_10_14_0_2_um_filter_35_18]
MIQRIQSLYLILIAVFSSGLMFVFPLWKDNQGVFYAYQAFKSNQIVLMSIAIAFLLVSFLAILSLFTYKKRKNQFVLNRLNLIINLYLLGVLLYYLQNLSGETLVSEKGIGAFFPVLNIVLLVFANRAIQKDEALVKSVDRLR